VTLPSEINSPTEEGGEVFGLASPAAQVQFYEQKYMVQLVHNELPSAPGCPPRMLQMMQSASIAVLKSVTFYYSKAPLAVESHTCFMQKEGGNDEKSRDKDNRAGLPLVTEHFGTKLRWTNSDYRSLSLCTSKCRDKIVFVTIMEDDHY
jgi:hypothetical protein